MRKLTMIALALLTACATPEPNVDPDMFKDEIAALAAVSRVLPVPTGFRVTDREGLDMWCREPGCFGTAVHSVVVLLGPVPENRCEWLDGSPYAYIVIHEIAHTWGYAHGQLMDDTVNAAWAIYRKEHDCD